MNRSRFPHSGSIRRWSRRAGFLTLGLALGSGVTDSASGATFKRVLAEQFGATW
ncbi:MAG: hypothetical protein R3E97_11430 [Candidatus Eisenbacteria bacterium]